MLISYEMKKLNLRNGYKSKTAFKDTKVVDLNEEDIDEIEAKFLRIMRKGSRKYEGKLPFKCFNCGEIGHYTEKCP